MAKIRELIILILIIVILFQCNKPAKIKTRTEVYHTTDTIIKTDSFYHNNLSVKKVILLDTIFKYKTDSFDYNFLMHEYHYKINDSLLSGTIIAKSPFKPDIDFNYKVKSFEVKDSTYIKERDLRGFFYGGSVSVSPLMNQVNIGIAYQFKTGYLIDLSLGRDFFNKNTIITLGYKKRF